MTTTLIAKRTRVGGLIETEGDVLIEGRVEGTIRAGGCVTIGPSGVVVSEVHAARAVILGILIGDLTARERIDVAASARVVGDVRAPVIALASPDLVEGRVEELGRATLYDPLRDAEEAAPEPGPAPVRPTLRSRGGPLVRPAGRSSPLQPLARTAVTTPPVPGPPRATQPAASSLSSSRSSAAVDAVRAGRATVIGTETPRPLSLPRRRPTTPPAPERPLEPDADDGPDGFGPAATLSGPAPAPPPLPRPQGRVRVVTRGSSGED